MHAAIIIAPAFLTLALAGMFADIIAPRHPRMLEWIYSILDRIM